MGVDVQPVIGRETFFGFTNEDWKPWVMPDGLEVLVPGNFNTTVSGENKTFIYPKGDINASPSAVMPEGGYFFDAIERQDPIDDDNLNVEDWGYDPETLLTTTLRSLSGIMYNVF